MAKVIEKNSIKIGKEPVVVLTLKKWEKIMDYLDEVEEKERFIEAFEESRGKRGISLNILKKKYRL